jgi:ribosomal protein L12E/L44/L45/RPP1/RPP2
MLFRLTFVLVFICALSQAPTGRAVTKPGGDALQQNRNWISQRGKVWVWNRDENGNSLEMTVRGEVEFNDDYTEVKRIADGASLEIRETRGGARRRLEIEAGQGGGLSVSYFVNGQSRAYDAEAKAWFARVLDEAVTESGLNAGPRAQKILKERGTGGLLDEISRLKSDHVKHLYFQELLKSGNLDARAATRAIGIAAREMSSDHYKAQVLTGLPEQFIRDEATRTAFLEAAGTIRSDHYRAQTLLAGLKSDKLSKEALQLALKGVGGISSDHYKTQVLLKVADGNLEDGDIRSAYVAAATTIGSDHYLAQSLSVVLKRSDVSKESLQSVLKAASGISSDHYKAQVLLGVAGGSLNDDMARSAFVETAATIGSDHYRAQALSALLSKGDNSKEALLVALKAAAGMSSDHYKAQTLLKLAKDRSDDETVRAALIEAARSIKSDHERGRVLAAIFK